MDTALSLERASADAGAADARDAGALRRNAPAAAIALTAAVVGGLLFGRFLFPYAVPVGFDESYMVPFAERIIDGHFLPYVDAVSQRGPVLYWVLAVAQLVFGRYEWVGIRVVTLAACLVTVVATYLAGVAARFRIAGAVGGSAVVLVVAFHGGPRGLCGEAVATPCLALSFCALAAALRRAPPGRRRLALLVLSGVLAALAALAKQTTGIAALPFLGWALAEAFTGADPRAPRRLAWLAGPLGFAAGFAAIFAALIAFYAAHHALRELVYWGTTYNATIYMEPFQARYGSILLGWLGSHLLVLLGMVAVAAFAVIRPVTQGTCRSLRGLAAAYARTGFEVTAALTAVLLFAVALMPARFWWHYFLVVWPWIGLVAGALVEIALRRGGGATFRKQALVAAPLIAVIAGAGAYRLDHWNRKRAAGAFANPRPSRLCAEIDRVAAPGESLFVWGFDGDVYINCRRRPAARFTYLTLVAGIVPPFWGVARPERVARDAPETLLADLEQSRPKVIVDYPIHGFAMDRVPVLADFLARAYCPLPRMRGKLKRKPKLYVRRDGDTCPGVVDAAPPDDADPGNEGNEPPDLEGADTAHR